MPSDLSLRINHSDIQYQSLAGYGHLPKDDERPQLVDSTHLDNLLVSLRSHQSGCCPTSRLISAMWFCFELVDT